MDRLIVVEILGRGGSVTHRVRLDGSATVGRAYDNDVILDDPFVDAHAISVSAADDGSILVRDLGATNGVYDGDGRRLGESAVLRAGDALRVGRTRMRVVRADTPVAPTLADKDERLRALTSSRASLPIAMLAFALFWSMMSYVNSVEDFTFAVLVTELLGLLVVFGIWAGAWALGTRLSSGRGRFGEHATITVALATVSIPMTIVLAVIAFLWPGRATDALEVGGMIVIVVLMLFAHLGVASRMPALRRGVVAGSIVLSLAGLGYLAGTIDPPPEVPVQSSLGALLAVPEPLIPATDLDGFLDDALDALASDLEEAEGE